MASATSSLDETEETMRKFSLTCTDELEPVLRKRQYVLQVRSNFACWTNRRADMPGMMFCIW